MTSYQDPFGPKDPEPAAPVSTTGNRPVEPTTRSSAARFAEPTFESPPPVSGLNALLAAANALLNVVPRLRATLQHPDPQGLQQQLAHQIKSFETNARAAGIPERTVIGARYCLCTLLDETIAATPWGSGVWSQLSLLVAFHKESFGGEKFFQLLSALGRTPTENRDLLELMYVCLGLGLKGRFGAIDNGQVRLDEVREKLAQILRESDAGYERDLSPNWRGLAAQKSRSLANVPLWVAGAVCALLLVGTYIALSASLNSYADPVYARIQSLRVKAPPPKPPVPAPAPRLAHFLAEDIGRGLVDVRDDDEKSLVTIRGDGLFEPGSATIAPAYLPLLVRIGQALNRVPGHVLVTGHTDDRPIRSIRFPSNWHLSTERAQAVVTLLTQQVPGARMTAEGRAESEPIVPNTTPEGRAQNRRVEITVFVQQTPRK